tara:strand:+ start:549 stop:1469 length:921 start_codon:yes stop_codon:yes gene_type:complete
MAFKMKNPSIAKMVKMAGNNRTAMKMKAEEAAAMKMKKAAMKLKEEAAMKKAHEAAMKLKKESAMKAAKPDFPDIDGDGNTSESMKKAAADKKSGMKMKKESSMKMGHKSPAKMGHKSPKKMKKDDSSMKMGHSPKKMKKESSMKLKEGKGTKKLDMPDFASPEQVKAKTGGGTKKIDNSKIKSPAKLRKPKPKRPKDQKDHKEILRNKGVLPKDRPKGSAMKLSEADKKKAMENAMPEAEVKGRFTRDRDLEKQMTKLKNEMGIIKRSDYADQKVREKEIRRVQKQIDALNQKGYFKAKARAGVK